MRKVSGSESLFSMNMSKDDSRYRRCVEHGYADFICTCMFVNRRLLFEMMSRFVRGPSEKNNLIVPFILERYVDGKGFWEARDERLECDGFVCFV